MKPVRLFATVASLILCLSVSAHALVIDHAYVNSFDYDGLGQEVYDAIGQQTWMFTHASVGGNMLGGMDTLHSTDSSKYQLTTPYWAYDSGIQSAVAPPSPLTPGSIYDVNRSNPGWSNKYQIFANSLASGWGNAADFVMDKLCYIDQTADVSVYLSMMQTLEATYNAVLVYATMPLTTASDSNNILRNLYNQAVRDFCLANDKLLFDIADLEAYDGSGIEQTFESNGETYQKLAQVWTSDGGHLNGDGRVMVAEGWYVLAATQTMDASPVPEPSTMALLGLGVCSLVFIRRRS